MSVDSQHFMDLVVYLHLIWSAPFQIMLAIVFLYFTMGPSVFAGVAVMILMIPFNAVIASISRKLQVRNKLGLRLAFVCNEFYVHIKTMHT